MAKDGHSLSMVVASNQKHYQVGPLFRARVKVAELKLQHMVVVTQVETCTRPSQVMCMVVWKFSYSACVPMHNAHTLAQQTSNSVDVLCTLLVKCTMRAMRIP